MLALHQSSVGARAVMVEVDTRNRHEAFPLSDIQHAYWIGRGESLELGNVACHVYFEWRLDGVDLKRLEQAWNHIVERHDMMRAIVDADGRQRILPKVPYYEIEIAELPDDPIAAECWLEQTRNRMSSQVLDPGGWPLFELRASRLPSGSVHLHLDIDLLMFDVQSFHIFLGELEQAYQSLELLLPQPGLSFRDYVLTHEEAKAGDAYREARDWWLGRLDDIHPAPDLPFVVAPGSLTRPDFSRRMRILPQEKWQKLSEIGASFGLTGSTILLTAFSEILANWSNSPRFSLNLTHFNREKIHPDVMRLVGDFTSVLLVGFDGEAPISFVERAKLLQKDMWAGLAHRKFSGVEVMRELARRQGGQLSGTMMPVVFTSLLGLEIDRLADGSRPGSLLGEPLHLRTATPQVWLDHQVMIRHGNLVYNWITIDQLFPDDMIEDMLDAYGRLLERLAAGAESWHRPAGALTPQTQLDIRREVNRTAFPITAELLSEPVGRGAEDGGDAPALIHPDGNLTHDELHSMSDGVADMLHELGIAEGERVAVMLPKSTAQIAAVLGILKAGGVYVPLAHDIPAERFAQIHADAGILKVFCLLDRELPEGVARLTPDRMCTGGWPHVAWHQRRPDDLAYLIYTSGSTGMPKGVMITHKAANNTIRDINLRFGIGADDRVLSLSALAFDLSVYDIFGLLAEGGAVVLPREDDRLDPVHWLDLMRRHEVTVWNTVPALLDILLDHLEQSGTACPRGLRLVLLSGDWIPVGLPARLRAFLPDVTLVALGGATEASIWSNYFEIVEVDPDWRSIPYGYPLSNQRYHILDAHLRDRPDWVSGDLYIAGDGLAEGYWGDAPKTKAHFLSRPETGEKIYRTGDIARYWPDGAIEFLGRRDNQVKLGGYRVELGEVEAVLEGVPGIGKAAVTVSGTDGNGASRKIQAYIVADAADGDIWTEVDPLPDPVWEGVQQAGNEKTAPLSPSDTENLQHFDMHGDLFAQKVIERSFVRLGIYAPGQVFALPEIMTRCGILGKYETLLRQWADTLVKDGLLARVNAQCYRVLKALQDDARHIAMCLDRLRGACDWGTEADALSDWIGLCAERQLPMLTGEVDPLEILFPDGDYRRANSLYRLNPLSVWCSGIVASLIAQASGAFDGTLRIMEVGAGTGGTTAHLLPVLDPRRTRYLFTDLSDFFLTHARSEFSEFGFLDYARYDINLSPERQGYAPHSQHVLLAVNVLHDARNLIESLAHLRRILRPGGILIVMEATRNSRLQLITAGFLEGFSDFDDFRRERGLPLIAADEWCAAMRKAGFNDPDIVPRHGHDKLWQHVMICRCPMEGRILDEAVLDRLLSRQLSDYMRPDRYMLLDRLPLTSNGKVDRGSLPDLAGTEIGATGDFVVPVGDVEEKTASIWQRVLGLPQVGRNDNFFLLGGDSLLATRLSGLLRDELDADIPLRAIYEHPVLTDFARHLQSWGCNGTFADSGWQSVLPLRPRRSGTRHHVYLLPGSDGTGHGYRPLAEELPDDVAITALQPPGLAEDDVPLASFEALADFFAGEIAKQGEADGNILVGGWSFGAVAVVETVHRLRVIGIEPDGMFLIDPSPKGAFADFDGDGLRAVGDRLGTLEARFGALATELSVPGGGSPESRRQISHACLEHLGISTEHAPHIGSRFEAMLNAHLAALKKYDIGDVPDLPSGLPVLHIEAGRRFEHWRELPHYWPDPTHRVSVDFSHWQLISERDAIIQIARAIETTFI